jgi:O-acetylserine/cysteine efflux transporter
LPLFLGKGFGRPNFHVCVALVEPLPMAALATVFEWTEQIEPALPGLLLGSTHATHCIARGSTIVGLSNSVYLLRLCPASVLAPVSLLVPVPGIVVSALLRVDRNSAVLLKVVPSASRP